MQSAFDIQKSGAITTEQLPELLASVGLNVSREEIDNKVSAVSLTNKGSVDFEEFVNVFFIFPNSKVVSKLRQKVTSSASQDRLSSSKNGSTTLSSTALAGKKSASNIVQITGSSNTIQHSFSEEEKTQFVLHINMQLKGDKDLKDKLPINPDTMQLFEECKDGILLSKLINDSVSDTIDERVLNLKKPLNPFQITENNNVVINSAKAIGCSVVNIGSQDLSEGKHILVSNLIKYRFSDWCGKLSGWAYSQK